MGRQANRSLIDAFATKAAMIYFATVFPPPNLQTLKSPTCCLMSSLILLMILHETKKKVWSRDRDWSLSVKKESRRAFDFWMKSKNFLSKTGSSLKSLFLLLILLLFRCWQHKVMLERRKSSRFVRRSFEGREDRWEINSNNTVGCPVFFRPTFSPNFHVELHKYCRRRFHRRPSSSYVCLHAILWRLSQAKRLLCYKNNEEDLFVSSGVVGDDDAGGTKTPERKEREKREKTERKSGRYDGLSIVFVWDTCFPDTD